MSMYPMSFDEDFEKTLQKIKKNYPYELFAVTGIQPKMFDFVTYIKNFCESNIVADESIDGTSNSSSKDIVALEKDINKPLFKMVALNKIFIKMRERYGEDLAATWLESEILGKLYLHDAHTSTFVPYCYAYDLTRLAKEGLFFLEHNSGIPYNALPAQHLDTFINHVKEFVSFTSNRQAGAVGLPNITPYLYYFWRKDVLSGYNGCHVIDGDKLGIETFGVYDENNQNIKYFKQCIQSLIYVLNQPYVRDSIQSAFTNMSIFDHAYAHSLFDGVSFPDGTLCFDHIDNIVNLQVVIMDTIAEIRKTNVFTFPVLTFSLLTKNDEDGNFVGFDDEEFARWASDHNTQWFDSNFYLSSEVTALSNCCRLISNIKDIAKDNDIGYFNSVGGSGLSVGSVKVSTINLARIAYSVSPSIQYKDSIDIVKDYFEKAENEYINKLKETVLIDLYCLDTIRDIITTNKEKRHLLPNIDDGLIDMKHMYNTVGIIGVYETIRSFQRKLDNFSEMFGIAFVSNDNYMTVDSFGNTFYEVKAENFVKRIFDTIHNTINEFKQKYNIDYSINVEQVPAETAAQKLMQKDQILFGDTVVSDLPMYGNQFIPLGIKATLDERIRVAALFDSYLNGGAICHINYESTFNKEKAWEMLNYIAKEGLVYSAFTTKISACKYNHGFFGTVCPECGEKAVTSYARVVGFYTATGISPEGEETGYGSWSTARKEEYKLREWEK